MHRFSGDRFCRPRKLDCRARSPSCSGDRSVKSSPCAGGFVDFVTMDRHSSQCDRRICPIVLDKLCGRGREDSHTLL